MEETSRPRGYSITTSKIPIFLALRKVEELKPHEETVLDDLNGMVRTLRRDPFLRHPIIADSASGAVLDGTHRLAAMKQLNCVTIPAALIDYQNPLVKVDRWFRIIKGQSLHNIVKQIDNLSPVPIPIAESDRSLFNRKSYATLRDPRECFALKSDDPDPLYMTRHAFALEEIARRNHSKVDYTDNGNTEDLTETSVLMSTIRLEKEEVVDSCLKRLLFPPKSTRHLIPSRPLGVSVPLEWLKTNNVPAAEAKFEKHLATRSVRRLPEGSKVGSRRYVEEVFLFE